MVYWQMQCSYSLKMPFSVVVGLDVCDTYIEHILQIMYIYFNNYRMSFYCYSYKPVAVINSSPKRLTLGEWGTQLTWICSRKEGHLKDRMCEYLCVSTFRFCLTAQLFSS